jgi:hypothetical protein
MFAKEQLKELAEAKRLVVLQSDIHRGLLRVEGALLAERLAGVRAARKKLAANRPLLLGGAVIATVLAIRHWRALARWAPSVLTVWKWWNSLGTRH